jgi:endoglucanase Acf2
MATPTTRMRSMTMARAAVCMLPIVVGGGILGCDGPARASEGVKHGLGTYYLAPRPGVPDSQALPPVARFRAGEVLRRAAPTNQWYSSVIFERWSSGIHAHPMTYKATTAGFELGLPTQSLVTDSGSRELRYAHVPAVVVSPVGFKPEDARLSGFSDWSAEITLGAGPQGLKATILHGSPFSYYQISNGDVRFQIAGKPDVVADPRDGTHDPRVAAFTVGGHTYAVFAPTGGRYQWSGGTELILHLPAGKGYFAVAGLPDAGAATIRDFLDVAYAFPVRTRTAWSYDQKASRVRTAFVVETVAKEGKNLATLLGLYPHQWKAVVPAHASKYAYDSVRGKIRLIRGNGFTLNRTYHGTLPFWAGLEAPADRSSVDGLLVGDLARSEQLFLRQGRGTYWIGKGVGAVAQLMSVAEAEGKTSMRDDLLNQLKARLESWFDGRHPQYFVQDSGLGTFLGYPEEFGSISHMNDHHFHYGYWIMGAAHVALRDPLWIADEKWGGMVKKIVADIATDERDRSDFPFIRNFDAYEGHSWASGDAASDYGNNQESSSEAINAWASLILLGETTRNPRLRDLGIYLYTSEVASVEQYWFDLDHEVLPATFGKPLASMVFGGKVAYNTWWTQEPREILGINEMPVTPAATYLGRNPQYVTSVIGALPAEERTYAARGIRPNDVPQDIWQDVIASYMALADADAALALWNRQGMVEFGETRSHTLYWILSLREMGGPDFAVTADTPLYGVFRDKAGARTYLAYNAGTTPLKVTFSNGKVLDVAPRSLARDSSERPHSP